MTFAVQNEEANPDFTLFNEAGIFIISPNFEGQDKRINSFIERFYLY